MGQAKQNLLKRVIQALQMAAMPALLSRFDDLSHCVEASLAGIEVLKYFGIKAQITQCGLIGQLLDSNYQFHCGTNVDEIQTFFKEKNWEIPVDLIFPAEIKTDSTYPIIHAILDIEYRDQKAIVDLTAGQNNKRDILTGFTRLPPAITYFYKKQKWQHLEGAGWWLEYFEISGRLDLALTRFNDCKFEGLKADLLSLVQLALRCELDRDLFFKSMQYSDPELFNKVMHSYIEAHGRSSLHKE